jgi:hypothetical protein
MAKRNRTVTAEEAAWEAGYDDRTRDMLAHIARRKAEAAERRARDERRRSRPVLLRWLPLYRLRERS